jgi:beta-glucosidase
MERPLTPYEPIKTVAAVNCSTNFVSTTIDKEIDFSSKSNKSLTIEVVEKGIYQVNGIASYERNSLAQSSCSLSLNQIFCMSLPVNGTEGKQVTVQGLKLRLDKGFYELSVDFVKPGMQLERLSFTKE